METVIRKYLLPGSALALGIFSFWSYLLVYVYQRGFYSELFIPDDLIEINLLRVIQVLAVLSPIAALCSIFASHLHSAIKGKISVSVVEIVASTSIALAVFVLFKERVSFNYAACFSFGIFIISTIGWNQVVNEISRYMRLALPVGALFLLSLFFAGYLGEKDAQSVRVYSAINKDNSAHVIIGTKGDYFVTLSSGESGCGFSLISFEQVATDNLIIGAYLFREDMLSLQEFCLKKSLF
jgi:drug/metabolite transporter superfamily protein YnfA